MIKRIKHLIKRKIQKIHIWYMVNMENPELKSVRLNSNQSKAMSICLLMINDDESELMVSSKGKRFISLKDNNAIIDGDKVSIINHIYSYDIFITGKALNNLIKRFDNRLDSDAEKLEIEIYNRKKNSLDFVLSNLKNKK